MGVSAISTKRLSVGILAHVDSGKTTLSESMLYLAGSIRKQGRVDHKDSFLDNNHIERERGITIFSKIAVMDMPGGTCYLLDTPGHIDFSSEMERTLQVLDYAILVISGSDGVQSHTETLWRLLENYNIPTFIFINKMDLGFRTKEELMSELGSRLGTGCVDFSADADKDAQLEELAMCDEDIMEEYLGGQVSHRSICDAVMSRKVFPCCFGSALKNQGVEHFMDVLDTYTIAPPVKNTFGAKVYKISEDDRGNRLTHIKITGGSLDVKTELEGDKGGHWVEKINEIRIYNGEKYTSVQTAPQGTVCAVTGLTQAQCGDGLGSETDSVNLSLEPVFSYKVILPEGVSDSAAYMTLKKLNDEETKLNVVWNAHLREIHMQLMGEVQTEIIRRIIKERFDMDVEFEQGGIIYKETISDTVEGVGHYEPLRHYAEVHLVMEPGEPGSGVRISSKCRDDRLDINWQRLILTHLTEKTHLGVLTGSPITDINITLTAGRAHQKHTEGGDFRQATYRAVRHGLRNATSVLLEPWYSFVITVPRDSVGRVMNDISNMGGSFNTDSDDGDLCTMSGYAPVVKIRDYQKEIISFTKGRGRMSCTLDGYRPCSDAESIIAELGYDCDSDVDNTADSVFCSHGTSVIVKWNEVYDNMHIESTLKTADDMPDVSEVVVKNFDVKSVSDDELNRIFEMTFGKPKEKAYVPRTKLPTAASQGGDQKKKVRAGHTTKPEYILVDGYNIIFAWKALSDMARDNIDLARHTLINRLVNYRAVKGCELLIVFDAYKVKNNPGYLEQQNGISIVYTKEAETADSYIEKTSHKLAGQYTVRVATSDGLEQMIILGNGALRVPASAFEKEVLAVEQSISDFLRNQ